MIGNPVNEIGLKTWVELDLHVREPFPESLKNGLRRHWDPEDGRAHSQEGPLPALGHGRARHRAIGELERQPCLVEEHSPGLGELDAAPVADEKLRADRTLELLDLLRKPRLRDLESIRCSTEMELLRYSDEVSELAEFCVRHCSPSKPTSPERLLGDDKTERSSLTGRVAHFEAEVWRAGGVA